MQDVDVVTNIFSYILHCLDYGSHHWVVRTALISTSKSAGSMAVPADSPPNVAGQRLVRDIWGLMSIALLATILRVVGKIRIRQFKWDDIFNGCCSGVYFTSSRFSVEPRGSLICIRLSLYYGSWLQHKWSQMLYPRSSSSRIVQDMVLLFRICQIKQSAGEFTLRHALASSKDLSKPVPHCP